MKKLLIILFLLISCSLPEDKSYEAVKIMNKLDKPIIVIGIRQKNSFSSYICAQTISDGNGDIHLLPWNHLILNKGDTIRSFNE